MRPDRELVDAARGGSRLAFSQLLTRHRPRCVALATRMLRDHGAAHDAVQEAAITAWMELERLRDPSAFGSWLAGITLNVARTWLRAPGKHLWCPVAITGGSSLALLTGDEPVDPADVAVEHELVTAVHDAVRALPDGQRNAVVHYYLEAMTQLEVAAALGTSPAAVKTRLAKARARLRQTLLHLVEEPTMTVTDRVPVTVAEVSVLQPNEDGVAANVVVLRERDGDRWLPIWVGGHEGFWLAAAVEDLQTPRPMTHNATLGLLEAAGAAVAGAAVTRLDDSTYLAEVTLDTTAGRRVLDVRPSDAMILATLAGAPIEVDASLLDPATCALYEERLEQAQFRGTEAIVQQAREAWLAPASARSEQAG